MSFLQRERFVFFRPLVYWSLRRAGSKGLKKNKKNCAVPPLHATWAGICRTESKGNLNHEDAKNARLDGRERGARAKPQFRSGVPGWRKGLYPSLQPRISQEAVSKPPI
jgi:hypothetical protein